METMNMQHDWEWVKSYYTPEQLEALAKRGTPEVLEKGQADWTKLLADIEAHKSGDPHGPAARDLAKRWRELIDQFTAGDPAIEANLRRVYADAGKRSGFKPPLSPEAHAFMTAALAGQER